MTSRFAMSSCLSTSTSTYPEFRSSEVPSEKDGVTLKTFVLLHLRTVNPFHEIGNHGNSN